MSFFHYLNDKNNDKRENNQIRRRRTFYNGNWGVRTRIPQTPRTTWSSRRLNRIQKVIPPSEKLSDHIQKKKIQIRAKICNTKQVEEKTLTDLNDVNIQEEVDQATKLTTHSSECATPEDEYINAQPHIEYDTDNINTQQINDIDEPIETLEAT